MAAINDAATDRVELDNAIQRELWIENPYHEEPELLREDFQLHEAVTGNDVRESRELPPDYVKYERRLYKHIPSLADLRVRIRRGGHLDRYELDTVELQSVQPSPDGQAQLANVNIKIHD